MNRYLFLGKERPQGNYAVSRSTVPRSLLSVIIMLLEAHVAIVVAVGGESCGPRSINHWGEESSFARSAASA